MKKILLGTTAFLVASVAMAAEAPTAIVSGFLSTDVTTISQTNAATRSTQSALDAGWNVSQSSPWNEIHFTARGKTDAGLSYMGMVEHRFIGTAPSIDEAFIEFSDSWGRLQLGQNDSPVDDNKQGGHTVLAGTGAWNFYSRLVGDVGTGQTPSGDDAKVVYYLPTIAGVAVGLSLAPSGGEVNTSPAGHANTRVGLGTFVSDTRYRNAAEGSITYTADLGGAKVTLGANYSQAKYNIVTNTDAALGAQEADFNNHRGYNYGVKVVAGAFSIGAGHTDHGKGGILKVRRDPGQQRDNGSLTSLGLGYNLGGGTTVGVGVANSKTSIVAGANWKSSATSTFWTAGVTTAVAPGLSVFGEFNTISGSTGAVTNGGYRGNEAILGTRITF